MELFINKRPNTKELVNIISKILTIVIKEEKIDLHEIQNINDFEQWLATIESLIPEIKERAPEVVKELFPLRTETWKLVFQKIYNRMPYSKEYILKNYKKHHKDIPYLFYPTKNQPSKLIILFTGYINYEAYNRMSWYWDETEKWETDTAYLFLGDQSLHWYVGTPEKPQLEIYKEIILNTLAELNLETSDAFTVGASMGGYASIIFGILCKLGGIISVHPQLCKKSAERYQLDNWKRQISECGMNFIEIDDLIAKSDYIPPLYLEVGRHPADVAGLQTVILEINNKNGIFILKRIASNAHDSKSPEKKQIEDIVEFFINSNKY